MQIEDFCFFGKSENFSCNSDIICTRKKGMRLMNLKSKPTITVLNADDHSKSPDQSAQVINPDDSATYIIEDWVDIIAKNSQGKDISDKVVYDASNVDFSKPGDYPVLVSVMDDDMNMASTSFTIHVLSEKDTRRYEESQDLEQPNETKKHYKISWLDVVAVVTTLALFILAAYTIWDAF